MRRSKRRRCEATSLSAAELASRSLRLLRDTLTSSSRIVIVSGSGLSVAAGLSTFSCPGGLYEKAKKEHKVKGSAKQLFHYSFFEAHPEEANAFFAKLHGSLVKAQPTGAHRGIARLARTGRLVRHYTMNIDGLHAKAGMGVWQAAKKNDFEPFEREGHTSATHGCQDLEAAPAPCGTNPADNNGQGMAYGSEMVAGSVVEMHGSGLELVCREGHRCAAAEVHVRRFRRREPVTCGTCGLPLRWRIMLYGDKDDERHANIVEPDILAQLQKDVAVADAIVWVGISFEQSASLSYFRTVRRVLQDAERHLLVPQFVVNVSDEAWCHLQDAVANFEQLPMHDVRATADQALGDECLKGERDR